MSENTSSDGGCDQGREAAADASEPRNEISDRLRRQISRETRYPRPLCLEHFCDKFSHRESSVRAAGELHEMGSKEECPVCQRERERRERRRERERLLESGEIDEKMDTIHGLMSEYGKLTGDGVTHSARLLRERREIVTEWDEIYAEPNYRHWDILDADVLIENLRAQIADLRRRLGKEGDGG